MPKIQHIEVAGRLGSGTQDITIPGFGVVNGVIAIASSSTALDTNTAGEVMAFGMSDFTTDRSAFINNEDGVTPTNTRRGSVTDFLRITNAGTGAISRSITTIVAITDGVRVTWAQSGISYRLKFMLVQDPDIDVQFVTTSATIGGSVKVITNFPPRLLIAFSSGNASTSATQAQVGYGFCSINGAMFDQFSIGRRLRDAQAAQVTSAQIRNNRLMAHVDNSGSSVNSGFASYEVTTSDAVGWFVVTRDNGSNNPFTVMSLGMAGMDVAAFAFDLPNSAASDWTPTLTPAISFTPDHVHCVLSKISAYNTAQNDVSDAGAMAVCSFDSTSLHTVGWSSQQGANPTNAGSRLSQALYLNRDNSTVHYDMVSPNLISGGWRFDAADITVASAETDRCIGFAIAAPEGAMMNKMMHEGGLNV